MTEIHDTRLHAYNPSSPEYRGDENLEKEALIELFIEDDLDVVESLVNDDQAISEIITLIAKARKATCPLDRTCQLIDMMQVFEDFLEKEVSKC
jgi:hypothetical protein